MSKVGSMTLGLVFIFLGVQLFLVKSYLLTPTATQMVNDYFNTDNGSQFANSASSNGGLFTSNSNSSNGIFSNSSFTKPQGNQGQMARYPGQSWPYYNSAGGAGNGNAGNVFQSGSYASQSNSIKPVASISIGQKRFVPPKWIMWPALFLGTVFFLHGVALKA